MSLSDAGFFYNVTDNCEDSIHIEVAVKSNEVQENDIAKLSEYKMAGSVEQAEFLYLATRCGEMGGDSYCKSDPTMQSLKVRFYEIMVTATDSAGNSGSDTCKVIIVPKCTDSPNGCDVFDVGGPARNDERKLQSGDCPEEYTTSAVYGPGDLVSVDNTIYQCAESPRNLFCGMIGYRPGADQHWDKAWKVIGSCSGNPLNTETSPFEGMSNRNGIAMSGCPEKYDAGVLYKEGDTVTVNNSIFRCKGWPNSGHCSQVGYKPLETTSTPDSWKTAWDFIGNCDSYEKLDVVNAAVAQSGFRSKVAVAELVWEFGLDLPH